MNNNCGEKFFHVGFSVRMNYSSSRDIDLFGGTFLTFGPRFLELVSKYLF